MAAGLVLKNSVSRHPDRVDAQQLHYLREELPRALVSNVVQVRRAAAAVMSVILKVRPSLVVFSLRS